MNYSIIALRFGQRRPPAPPDSGPATELDRAPDMRARDLFLAHQAFETVREPEEDELPSSRPDALAKMGIGALEIEPDPGGYELSYFEENDNDDERRGQ